MKNRKTSINDIWMLDADVLQNAAMVQLKGGTTNIKASSQEVSLNQQKRRCKDHNTR